MKKAFLISLPAALLTSQLFAAPPVIYGEDGRMEVFEASPMLQKLAKSAASMIPIKEISASTTPGMSVLTQRTLGDWLKAPGEEGLTAAPVMSKIHKNAEAAGMSFCASERFTDQPNPGMCSGFLIAPDLLVTAGHCVVTENFCEGNKWVFDFKVDDITGSAGLDIKNDNIYSCKRVLSGALEMDLGADFGLVQLDRDVVGREPLTLAGAKFVELKQGVVVIGGPSGLPLKVTTGGTVRTSSHPFYFAANLDTFQGNSGSAVFNAETGVVEGILVRGEEDFEVNDTDKCVQAKKCKDDECRGEDVSRMISMPEIAVQKFLDEAIISGNMELLSQVLELGTWVDFYGKDKVTPLMVAAKHARASVLEKLISSKADVKLVDLDGNTALHHLAQTLTTATTDAVDVLTKAGLSLEVKNLAGQTPILVAAASLSLEGVRALIEAGADRNATDNLGATVVSSFEIAGDLEAVRELASLGILPQTKP